MRAHVHTYIHNAHRSRIVLQRLDAKTGLKSANESNKSSTWDSLRHNEEGKLSSSISPSKKKKANGGVRI